VVDTANHHGLRLAFTRVDPNEHPDDIGARGIRIRPLLSAPPTNNHAAPGPATWWEPPPLALHLSFFLKPSSHVIQPNSNQAQPIPGIRADGFDVR